MKYFILFLFISISSSFPQIIKENFNDNSSHWKLETTNEYSSAIQKGVLRMSTNFDQAYFLHKEFFHSSDNYKIKFKFKWISGIKNYGFGLKVGNAANAHKYSFAADGHVSLIKQRYDIISNTDWVPTPIKPDWNEVVIYRFNNNHIIFLNGKPVVAKYLETLPNNYISFVVENKQVIEFDDLEVSYLNIDDRLKFLKENSSAAGTSQNNYHIFNYTYTDEFSEVVSSWIKEKDASMAGISNGVLTFANKAAVKKVGTLFQSFPLSSDFRISCKTIWNSGDNEGYGIGWGGNFNGECSSFLISQSGYYSISTEKGGFTGWTFSDAINKGGINNISIKSENGSIYFYINDQFVHTVPYLPFNGDLAGFVVIGNQQVSFDDFKLTNKDVDTFEKASNNLINFRKFFTPLEDASFTTTYYDSLFRIEHKLNEGNGVIGEKEIISGKDYRISASLLHEDSELDPEKEFVYGMVFNAFDWNNYYELIISNANYFKIRIKSYEAEYSTDWIMADLGKSGPIDLAVEKHEDQLYYFINNKQVFTTPYYGNMGNSHGIVSYKDQVIQVYDFQIKDFQPDLAEFKPEIRKVFR